MLSALVAKGYTGEGFWSRGHTMSEDLTAPRHLSEAEMPDNLCGGTYRSAKKPEKRKLTYAERKERRKVKLFGKGEGDKMGANEALRASLEKGKSKKAISVKPRVAQSQRGRDLRMEAALRREKASQAESSTSAAKKEESGSDSGDTEYETEEEEGTVDVGGGNRMVRVASEGEDGDEWAEFKDELNDMCSATALSGSKSTSSTAGSSSQKPAVGAKAKPSISQRNGKRKMEADDSETEKSDSEDDIVIVTSRKRTAFNEGVARRVDASDNDDTTPPPPPRKVAKTGLQKNRSPPGVVSPKAEESENDALPPALPKGPTASTVPRAPVAPETRTDARLPSPGLTSCAVCTMENMPDLALCAVCGNVLNTIRTPSWKCPTPACLSTGYSVSVHRSYWELHCLKPCVSEPKRCSHLWLLWSTAAYIMGGGYPPPPPPARSRKSAILQIEMS